MYRTLNNIVVYEEPSITLPCRPEEGGGGGLGLYKGSLWTAEILNVKVLGLYPQNLQI